MTSQADKQIIGIHILSNISRSKDNQGMKFGHPIEYNVKNTFQKIMQKTRQIDWFETSLCFKKALYKVKGSTQSLSFNMSW